jgi:hypothetical protein
MVQKRKEVKTTMCMHHPMAQHGCGCQCGGEEFLTLDEEIQRMEIHRQHLKFQLAMLERRVDSLKKAGK